LVWCICGVRAITTVKDVRVMCVSDKSDNIWLDMWVGWRI